MRGLDVFFNKKRVKDGQIMDLQDVQVQPQIKFDKDPNKKYCFIMVDPDAPSRDNSLYKYVLHWLIINNNETIMNFEPPNPPKGSGLHRYFICVYQQVSNMVLPKNAFGRKNFSVSEFIKKYNLTFLAGTMFRTERV
jgi:phosphatidylethanolamine-binding protein (PEBP) family uncharacterized protein